jgi:uncharacterized DUF497 family protein
MSKKIDLSNSEMWQSLDWDEKEVHPNLKKTDTQVNRARSAYFKRDNLEFSETMKQVSEERNQNPKYQENHRIGVTVNRDNSYQAIDNARPEKQAKISKAMTGKEKTPEHIAKVAKKTRERGIPCVTPFGIFRTGADAGRKFDELKLGLNGKKTVNKYIKQKRDGYYQISLEEYIMITGTDV